MGGKALIGRQLYPLLNAAGFHEARISPRMDYVDASRAGMIDEAAWEQAIADLNRTTENDGTFIYTFFKGVAFR